ncbi:zinc finger MYM-type protein 1-like protein [Tanacetum coccineum]
MRRFRYEWYQKYSWLEYSISKDSAFCYVCYLFNVKDFNGMGGDAFVRNGFKGWNRPVGFTKHVGKLNSVHNQAREKYESLIKPKTSIQNLFDQQSAKYRRKYRTRLLASLHCSRLLLHQGLSTRGKKEGLISNNKGNFLELLAWLAKHNEDINKVVLGRAPKNHKLTSPLIQRDLMINCCAKETTKIIIKELGEDYFTILADESCDVSHKEKMSLCLRYVDKKRDVVERFLGILHVKDTTALTLRDGIHSMLAEHSLSPSRIRGQVVLDKIGDMPSSSDNDKLKAEGVSFAVESFDFVFMAHLMKTMFGVSNELNVALQKQD